MAAKRKKSGFDKFFDEQMRDAKFRKGYEKVRGEIAAVDALVRALDAVRIEAGISKAELARKISAEPAAIRRLFTAERANPTLATFAKLAKALDCELSLVPRRAKARPAARQPNAATKKPNARSRAASKSSAALAR